MNPGFILRAEGLAVLTAAGVAFALLGGPAWLFVLLFFAPDLAMLAYLAGPRVGAAGYNLVHTYVGPLALAGAGVWLAVEVAVLLALVWAAHLGFDRLLGYGLKYPTAFGDTHLGRTGTRTDGPVVDVANAESAD